jgi:hypothetical protein
MNGICWNENYKPEKGGKMKKLVGFIGAIIMVGMCATSAFAVPSLQLDILGGTYDAGTETIVSSSNSFTLYALIVPDSQAPLDDTYYISVAINPQVITGTDLGSFFINGEAFEVTDDLVFENPPLEAYQDHDAQDLSSHGIFDTYFTQIAFTFDSGNTSAEYNTADNAGDGPSVGTGMYYVSFDVDTSGLDTGYAVHFDL